MPTPKQVRYHFDRLHKAYWKMQRALNSAHHANVIQYDGPYTDHAPCATHSDTWQRILKTTEKQLAQAMRQEIESNK